MRRALTIASLASLASTSAGALDGPQVCLEALKVAARDELKLSNSVNLDDYVHDQFCDAVKSKQQSKSSTNASALTASFVGKLSDDRQTLSNYEHNYCRDTEGKTKFTTAYNLWSSTVHGEPLDKFNSCMTAFAPNAGNFWKRVETTSACYSTATVAFRPTLAVTAVAKVNDIEPTNVSCRSIPAEIGPAEVTITCRRTGWDAGHLALNTSGGSVNFDFPAQTIPRAPSRPTFAERDTVHQRLTWRRTLHEVDYTCVNDGRDCQGPLPLPAGAVLTEVQWSCEGATNQNGHGLCGWSFSDGNKTSHEKNVVEVTPGQWRWYRYWDGDQNWVTEHYDMTYTVPHVTTAGDREQLARYDEQRAEYDTTLKNGPCPAR